MNVKPTSIKLNQHTLLKRNKILKKFEMFLMRSSKKKLSATNKMSVKFICLYISIFLKFVRQIEVKIPRDLIHVFDHRSSNRRAIDKNKNVLNFVFELKKQTESSPKKIKFSNPFLFAALQSVNL